jgi:putative membrane protein
VSARFLDDEARATFERAIRTIESVSAVEVVVAVRRRSHEYRNANLAVGTAVAFMGLAAMLFSQHPFGLTSILFDPFIVGIAAGSLVELLPGVKRVLTTPARRRYHVTRAAKATFVDRGVHVTESRSGLLVYISWLEQQVALVPDIALRDALSPDALAQLEREMTAAMHSGGARVATLLEKFSAELAVAAPRRHDDVNELPDTIDSDLVKR